jgi:hypothetical protein
MNAFTRFVLSAIAIGGLVLGFCAVQPEWANRLGLNPGRVPELAQQLAESQQRSEDLDEQTQESLHRLATKEEIVHELLAARLDLREAAAQFRDIAAHTSGGLEDLRKFFPGDSDEERSCRQVIAWVTAVLSVDSQEEANEMRARLEAQLQTHLGRDFSSHIPR